ncbi:MAG: hypothetical protein LBD17_05930 [Endomicrobium sp.]|nr:hypothetical protein [Endomicrobium sp.]
MQPKDEMTFQTFVQFFLLASGFDVKIYGSNARLELCFGIDDKVYVIFAIRHEGKIDKFTKAEENLPLALLAADKFDDNIISQYIVSAVKAKLEPRKVFQLLRESQEDAKTEGEKHKILLSAVDTVLTEDERNQVYANAARERLNQEKIKEALLNAHSKSKPTPTEINILLKNSAQEPLKDIDVKKYQSILGDDAKFINTSSLSIYAYGTDVYAQFDS